MNPKAIALLIIFLLFGLPISLKVITYATTAPFSPPEETIEKGTELIVDTSIPWYIGVMASLADLPSPISAMLIIIFIFFLIWIGVITVKQP
jgi:hypothetical protein